MAAKKVGFKSKVKNNQSVDLERWVSNRSVEEANSQTVESNTPHTSTPSETKPKMKRLTIDVTEELHRAIKMKAVEQGTPMADMLRELLESNYL